MQIYIYIYIYFKKKEEAINSFNRKALYDFLMRMKQPNGSFTMHEGGEIDTR
jgi:protein farnesyltransferase subunit beta